MATTSSKVAVAKGEGDFPERLICPVCFRRPEKEVFQCQDGHVLCSECYNKRTECPQCRGSLVKHQPIRNRFFEAELEQFVKVDCSFKSNGCAQKVRKDLLQQHQHSCYFNFEKFGSPLSLCKAMDLNCSFHFNQSNLKEFVDHFVSAHGAKMTKSMEFQMELCNFLGGSSSSVVERNSTDCEAHEHALEFFTPIVANLEEEECYILTIPFLNTSSDSFRIVSYYLPYFNAKRTSLVNPFKMEYSVSKAPGTENTGSDWSFVAVLTQNPMNLLEAEGAGLNSRSGCLQMSQLKSYITSENSLLDDCNTLFVGNEIKNKSSARLQPQPLVFKCRYISRIPNCTETKTVKGKRLSDFKGDSRADNYLKQFQALLDFSWTPVGQKRVLEKIDAMVESVIFKDKAYLVSEFGPENFEWILYNAMFLVVQFGNVEALKRMMGINGNGFDWDVVDSSGLTLLHLTILDRNWDRGVEKAKLLQSEVDVNVKALDDNGWSLAHHAAFRNNDKAMAFVCQMGLDINAKDTEGNTPLHLAMKNLHGVEITVKKVEVVLKHGADPDAKNEEGKTPLDVAASQWNKLLWEKVTELFQTHYMKKWKVIAEKMRFH